MPSFPRAERPAAGQSWAAGPGGATARTGRPAAV